MSGVLPCRRPLKVLLSCFPFLFSMGCVTTGSDGTTRSIKQNPELIVSANWRHNGTGDSAAVTSRIEQSFIEAFPNSKITGVKSSPDYVVDVTVFSKAVKESPFVSESRKCLRYSDPDPNEKNFFKKMLTVKCLNWGTERKNCTQKIYDLGVEIRGEDSIGQVVFIGRESFSDEVNLCSAPDTSDLKKFSELEVKAANWALGLFSNKVASRAVQKVQSASSAQVDSSLKEVKDTTGLKAQAPLPVTIVNYAAINSAHALVIGNSAYPGSAKLANPVNDAKAISAKLRSLGFKVSEVIDASRAQMVRSLSKFSETSENADVTLLFYAGHGVQISGINYMIPVDTNISDISEATLQAISLNSVVERYLPGKAKLVFLDACRDNPLMTASSRGVTRGLAPINVSEGTLISYATKDGQTAADGTGQKNSPYTAALLEHLGDPQDIGIVLRTVRAKVMQRTDNRQQPWEYGSLTGGALVLTTIKK